jgi:hypothetical protein
MSPAIYGFISESDSNPASPKSSGNPPDSDQEINSDAGMVGAKEPSDLGDTVEFGSKLVESIVLNSPRASNEREREARALKEKLSVIYKAKEPPKIPDKSLHIFRDPYEDVLAFTEIGSMRLKNPKTRAKMDKAITKLVGYPHE